MVCPSIHMTLMFATDFCLELRAHDFHVTGFLEALPGSLKLSVSLFQSNQRAIHLPSPRRIAPATTSNARLRVHENLC